MRSVLAWSLTGAFLLLFASPAPAEPERGAEASRLSGRYRLQADERLVRHDLVLEFFQDTEAAAQADPGTAALPESKSGLWSARVVDVSVENPATQVCSLCPPPFRGRPLLGLKILQGLRERDAGEFLYGRLVLPGQSTTLRCKVWRRGADLFLRIYEPGRHYSTHRLTGLP